MSGEAAFVRFWSVGRYRVELSCPRPKPGGGLVSAVIAWDPVMPSKLSPEEARDYRAGRDAALRDLATELKVDMGVLEL